MELLLLVPRMLEVRLLMLELVLNRLFEEELPELLNMLLIRLLVWLALFMLFC